MVFTWSGEILFEFQKLWTPVLRCKCYAKHLFEFDSFISNLVWIFATMSYFKDSFGLFNLRPCFTPNRVSIAFSSSRGEIVEASLGYQSGQTLPRQDENRTVKDHLQPLQEFRLAVRKPCATQFHRSLYSSSIWNHFICLRLSILIEIQFEMISRECCWWVHFWFLLASVVGS